MNWALVATEAAEACGRGTRKAALFRAFSTIGPAVVPYGSGPPASGSRMGVALARPNSGWRDGALQMNSLTDY